MVWIEWHNNKLTIPNRQTHTHTHTQRENGGGIVNDCCILCVISLTLSSAPSISVLGIFVFSTDMTATPNRNDKRRDTGREPINTRRKFSFCSASLLSSCFVFVFQEQSNPKKKTKTENEQRERKAHTISYRKLVKLGNSTELCVCVVLVFVFVYFALSLSLAPRLSLPLLYVHLPPHRLRM